MDIASVIYEVETILIPPGLCIFLRGARWWCLFYSILENNGATGDFYRYLAPKSDKKRCLLALSDIVVVKFVVSLSQKRMLPRIKAMNQPELGGGYL